MTYISTSFPGAYARYLGKKASIERERIRKKKKKRKENKVQLLLQISIARCIGIGLTFQSGCS
jgi:hypothetical protein